MTLGLAVSLAVLLLSNLGLIWFLMAAPAGRRTVRLQGVVAASPTKVWNALHPFGTHVTWDGSVKNVMRHSESLAELEINWDGRDGKPIRKKIELFDEIPGKDFSLRTVDDTSLDHSFWKNHFERVELKEVADGTQVTISETDVYKGFAFYWFRYFKNRRTLTQLKHWARTGEFKSAAMFEKLPVQIAMGGLSALILWPFFGLSPEGLFLSVLLTLVVALHEFGHLFAFKVMGHKKVRMIFVPVLGGVAIGGRPYDRHFEVAFSALMGPAFSAFFVAAAMAMYGLSASADYQRSAAIFGAFATVAAAFNLGNLVPMWKFDGGQVIRQVFESRTGQAIAAFILLGGLLAVCAKIGFSFAVLFGVGTVAAVLSLLTAGSGIKPKTALHPMSDREKLLILSGLSATYVILALGTVWGLTIYI